MHNLPLEIWQLIFSNFTVDLVPEIWDEGIGPDAGTKVPSGRGGGSERTIIIDGNSSIRNRDGTRYLRTLASLCRVCRMFRDLAQPLLYRSICQEDAVDGPRGWHTNLVRTLAGTHDYSYDTGGGGGGKGGRRRRRDSETLPLGQYVRAISLGARVYELFLDLDETLEAAFPSLKLPYICREHVRSGGGDYAEDHRSRLFMACLACTPNVEYVECHVRDSQQLFAAFIAGATSSPDVRALIEEERREADQTMHGAEPWKYRDVTPPNDSGSGGSSGGDEDYEDHEYSLRHLKRLRLRHERDAIPAKVTDIEPLLYHSSLRTLQLSGWNWTNRETHAMPCWRHNDHLETLELDDCVTDEEAIGDILGRFRNLRTLVVRLVRDSWGRSDAADWWEVWLPELTQTLVGLGANLTRLDLDTDECCGNVVGKLGSLRGMRSLQHLKVAYRDLLSPRDPDNDYGGIGSVELDDDDEFDDGDGRHGTVRNKKRSIMLPDLLPEQLETLCIYKSAFDETARSHYHALLTAVDDGRLPLLESVTVQCRTGEREKMADPLVFDKELDGWTHSSEEERRTSKLKGKGPTRVWRYRVSTRRRIGPGRTSSEFERG